MCSVKLFKLSITVSVCESYGDKSEVAQEIWFIKYVRRTGFNLRPDRECNPSDENKNLGF